jgi:hypothetical protein
VSASAQTRGRSSRRSALVNTVAATALLIGGSLFAFGRRAGAGRCHPGRLRDATDRRRLLQHRWLRLGWGTLTGALCFAIAGLMLEFEHQLGPRRCRDSA